MTIPLVAGYSTKKMRLIKPKATTIDPTMIMPVPQLVLSSLITAL